MRAIVEKIDPKKARKLLELNTLNFRPLEPKRVSAYAQEMASGKWELNGETIKVNGSVLLDGQHRLHAVIQANTTVEMLIVYDVATDARTIDRGKPRSLAQWLAHTGVKQAVVMGAMARFCLAHRKGIWHWKSFGADKITDSEQIEFVEKNGESMYAIALVCSKARKIVPQAQLAAILFCGLNGRKIEESPLANWFVDSLASGEGLCDTDAVLHLRNRLLEQSKGLKITDYMRRMLVTMAWNKTAEGKECSSAALRLRMVGPAKVLPPETIAKLEVE